MLCIDLNMMAGYGETGRKDDRQNGRGVVESSGLTNFREQGEESADPCREFEAVARSRLASDFDTAARNGSSVLLAMIGVMVARIRSSSEGAQWG